MCESPATALLPEQDTPAPSASLSGASSLSTKPARTAVLKPLKSQTAKTNSSLSFNQMVKQQ